MWPDGVVGSITHTKDFAAAAVASTADAISLGIDTERIMSEAQARQVCGTVAWPVELAHARAVGMSRLEALTLVFSVKETVFKCLYPRIGRMFDFHDVRVVNVHGHARSFVARIVRTLSAEFPASSLVHGRFHLDGHWVHTGMCLAAAPHAE